MSTVAPRSRRWALPVLVVLVWLLVGGPLGTFAGRLSSVQENDNAAYLPQSADSTVALERLAAFAGDEQVTATVVFARDGGLTPADLQVAVAYVEQLRTVEHVDPTGVVGPVPSPDGEAAQLLVPISTSDGDELTATVAEIRAVLEAPPDGLTAHVGGQAGILADFIVAFEAIDGLLLGVALAVVLLILLVVYRSPVLPLVVLLCAVLALGVASAAIYGLARADTLDVSGQSQGILFILAVGAATDYSLLIVARFREELRDHESRYDAMRAALAGATEPVVASGLTVVLGLLCLLLSDLSSLRGLGPVGAFGVTAAMLAALTLLPAALVLLGRWAFWPFLPRLGSAHQDTRGVWAVVTRLVGRRPRAVWAVTFLALAVAAGFVATLDEEPVPQSELFLTEVDSVRAQELLDSHFDRDRANPVVLIAPEQHLDAAAQLVAGHAGVAPDGVVPFTAGPPGPDAQPLVVDGEVALLATLTDPADSAAATDTVRDLRAALDQVSPEIVVGGQTAVLLDSWETTGSDRAKVIPAILLVIFVVLALLLRSLVAPLVLLVANVLSFGATIGISALLFDHVFGFPATDPATTLIGFVFLVALGIDYSIFLMTRVREESLRQGTHPGVLKGLAVTGGVITSAGVVLAATFAALSVLPILFLAQIAFIVAFGVLLDTFVVRSLLVPAASYDLGRRVWWPGRLWRTPDRADVATAEMLHAQERGGVPVDKLDADRRR